MGLFKYLLFMLRSLQNLP